MSLSLLLGRPWSDDAVPVDPKMVSDRCPPTLRPWHGGQPRAKNGVCERDAFRMGSAAAELSTTAVSVSALVYTRTCSAATYAKQQTHQQNNHGVAPPSTTRECAMLMSRLIAGLASRS